MAAAWLVLVGTMVSRVAPPPLQLFPPGGINFALGHYAPFHAEGRWSLPSPSSARTAAAGAPAGSCSCAPAAMMPQAQQLRRVPAPVSPGSVSLTPGQSNLSQLQMDRPSPVASTLPFARAAISPASRAGMQQQQPGTVQFPVAGHPERERNPIDVRATTPTNMWLGDRGRQESPFASPIVLPTGAAGGSVEWPPSWPIPETRPISPLGHNVGGARPPVARIDVGNGALVREITPVRLGRRLRVRASASRPEIELPPGSEVWTRFETDLFTLSDGVYHPGKMAQQRRINPAVGSAVDMVIDHSSSPASFRGTGVTSEVPGRVSVVTPTMSSRQRYHEQLWASFEAQNWPDKELIVVETYDEEPSKFLQTQAMKDSRLVHVCFQRDPGCDFSVGLKRNMALHLASGTYCVNFDDDDIYAPSYVRKMVGEMCALGLDALTLSGWFNYFASEGTCGYSDPESWSPVSAEELDEILYGYGFSYVHKRQPALKQPYPDAEFAEDAPFFLAMRSHLGPHRVRLKLDTEGLCLHIVHKANSAGDMPISRQVTAEELNKLEVAKLPDFQRFLVAASTVPRWPWQGLLSGFFVSA